MKNVIVFLLLFFAILYSHDLSANYVSLKTGIVSDDFQNVYIKITTSPDTTGSDIENNPQDVYVKFEKCILKKDKKGEMNPYSCSPIHPGAGANRFYRLKDIFGERLLNRKIADSCDLVGKVCVGAAVAIVAWSVGAVSFAAVATFYGVSSPVQISAAKILGGLFATQVLLLIGFDETSTTDLSFITSDKKLSSYEAEKKIITYEFLLSGKVIALDHSKIMGIHDFSQHIYENFDSLLSSNSKMLRTDPPVFKEWIKRESKKGDYWSCNQTKADISAEDIKEYKATASPLKADNRETIKIDVAESRLPTYISKKIENKFSKKTQN